MKKNVRQGINLLLQPREASNALSIETTSIRLKCIFQLVGIVHRSVIVFDENFALLLKNAPYKH